MATIDVSIRTLHPRHVFGISRARKAAVANVFVRLGAAGVAAWGEASPNPFYGESATAVRDRLRAAAPAIAARLPDSPAAVEAAWEELWPLFAPSRAAQCAADVALWDWLARREGVPLAKLLWDRAPRPVATFCTIGLAAPDELAAKLAEVRGFPRVKLKADATGSLASVRAARERLPEALLAVDANCAWDRPLLAAVAPALAAAGVAFIEQPLPPGADRAVGPGVAGLPVFADESCVVEADVARLAADYAGINVKLVKCGGITPARRMLRRARALGLRTMVGCMLESSVLIAAGAAVAGAADFADLDGAWLLADDPFVGWRFDRGVLYPGPPVTEK